MTATSPANSDHVLACMEVWGGNSAVESTVTMPGLDAWVYSRPYVGASSSTPPGSVSTSGGDIHYLTSCATGRITRMIVADVSGHGAPVAAAALSLRRLMRRHSNTVDQLHLVRRVNREFASISSPGEETGFLFATGVFASFFAPTDELDIVSAGHPWALHYQHELKRWMPVRPGETSDPAFGQRLYNLPLGVDDETDYAQVRITLREQDLVLLYTDALIEASDQSGNQLGTQGLVDVLDTLDATRPESLVRELMRTLESRRGSGTLTLDDDVTTLLLRRNMRKPSPSPWLGTLGAWRLFTAAIGSLRPGGLPAAIPDLGIKALGGSVLKSLNFKR